jgi:hypothetical protein
MADFCVVVDCQSGDAPHQHTMTVESGGPLYAVAPVTVRLQYTCPRTGAPLIAKFEAPAGAGRPFSLREVQ